MTIEDKKALHDKKSCEYAMKKCEELGVEPEDYAVDFADCYEDGYIACWNELSNPSNVCEKREKILDKSEVNEYCCIAYNALQMLVINASLSPIGQKGMFRSTMAVLLECYHAPL